MNPYPIDGCFRLWFRVDGPKGFDVDAPLPYRERLIVVYVIKNAEKENIATGEAFVHDGEWYWWEYGNHPYGRVKIDPEKFDIKAWTPYPHAIVRKVKNDRHP